MAVGGLAALAGFASLSHCATPTAIVVDVYSDLDCTNGAQVVLIGAQSMDALASSAPTATATRCDAQTDGTYYRGQVVLVPSTSDETVAFAIATRTNGADPSSCLTSGGDCIVAKREISFISQNELRARIDLKSACLGVSCPSDETCDQGQCVPAGVACNDGSCGFPSEVAPELAAGAAHTCALRIDGTVACWGDNSRGQLGDGTTTSHAVPTTVPGVTGASHLSGSGSGNHTCARVNDEDVMCWGANESGQIGDGTTTDALTAVNLGLCSCDDPVLLVSTGAAHTCIVRDNGGAVQCWGDDTYNQVGAGVGGAQPTPTAVLHGGAPLMGAVAIATGDRSSCAVMHDGAVDCWGDNTSGQLGTGDTSPVADVGTALVTGATGVAAGGVFACALTAGDPFCWGTSDPTLLPLGADGGAPPSGMPVDMTALAGARMIASANNHACAIMADGSVACWGLNDHGQCGDGTTTNRDVPGTVAGIANAITIAAGALHTCAWTHDGLYCWGDDSYGQLGDGQTGSGATPLISKTPVKITP
jgi:hypothetical protein